MIALSRADSESSARNSSRRAIWSASKVVGRRFLALGARTSRAGLRCAATFAHQKLIKRAHRRQAPLDAAGAEARGVHRSRRIRAHGHARARSSARSARSRRTLPSGRDRDDRRRAVWALMRRSCFRCEANRSDPLALGRVHGLPAPSLSASVRRSRARRCAKGTRCSCAGWNRSASLAPIARMPSAPLGPSGSQRHRADLDGILAEQEVALRVADLSAARLARLQQRFESLDLGIRGIGGSQESAVIRRERRAPPRGTAPAPSSSRRNPRASDVSSAPIVSGKARARISR